MINWLLRVLGYNKAKEKETEMSEIKLEPIEYKISRVSTSNKDGTFGVFLINNRPVCFTLEETWLNNQRMISCIPEGIYTVKKYSGTKYKNVWQVYGVPNRTAILIHWGNTERNTAGCILVGKYVADFGDLKGVADSKSTIDMLRSKLPNEFRLYIENNFKEI